MNSAAVFFGFFYGVVSAVIFYAVSMLTSGLFSRPFYRLYARVLIGICCIMLAAPGLRWLATEGPLLGTVGLTLAQYVTVGILFYGVLRFNRDYMQRVFLKRAATAYFTFGTLANATVVTLAFLQMSVSGAPAWIELDVGHFYVDAAGYGPLIVLLAAMVFHTDYHLKKSLRNMRRFSRFTFVGYAISFVGISLSLLPYLGNALAELGLSQTDRSYLQNASSAQTLMIAISLYAWLVWRYESIPPLFMLLFALIGEYHVLVTQWSIRWFGPASWGLASLPLFVGISLLNEYFRDWDRRKRKSRGGQEATVAAAHGQTEVELRFAFPFQAVHLGLGIALVGLTLWTRFAELPADASGWLSFALQPHSWLGATFGAYAIFYFGLAFFRQQSQLVYVGGTLAALAALLGFQTPAEPMSVTVLAGLSLTWGSLAFLGDVVGLKRAWRTALADCSFLSAIVITTIVLSRHVWGVEPYHFQLVSFFDGTALTFAILAFACCTHQYRSWLPMFGGVVALATIAPTFSAGLGFLAATAAALAERWLPKENALALENRVLFLTRFKLPWEDVLPQLYVHSLSIGAIPLALVGLLISIAHVLLGDFSIPVLFGAASSSLVLGLLTRTERAPWLYVVSLAAAYFSMHATAHGYFFADFPLQQAISAHLLLAVVISLVGWSLARAHALWCNLLLKRVAEAQEPAIRARRSYYSGLLQSVTGFVSVVALAAVAVYCFSDQRQPELSLSASTLLAVFFGLAAAVYRSQIGSYLSLTAITVAVINALSIATLPVATWPLAFASLGLLGAVLSFGLWGWRSSTAIPDRVVNEEYHVPLTAQGIGLWPWPLAIYACLCALIAVISVQQPEADKALVRAISQTALLTYGLASAAIILSTRALRFPALYLCGIALGFLAAHATMQAVLFGDHLGSEVLAAHLVLGAAISLASSFLAVCFASVINVRHRSASEDQADSILGHRDFFAGLLQHFALLIAVLLLFALGASAWNDPPSDFGVAQLQVAAGLLLCGTFAFSGAVYRSRIQSYLALGAACLAVAACVATFVPPLVRMTYQDVFLAAAALAFGLVSWLLGKPKKPDSMSVQPASWTVPQCWRVLPLPMLSCDRELWAKPLAHVSILVTIIAVANALRNWGQGNPWLFVAVFYLAATTWFVATRTYRLGVLDALVLDKPSDPQGRLAADRIERGVLFVTAVLSAGIALHVSADLLVLEQVSQRLLHGWQLFFAVVFALTSWGVATVYSARCSTLLEDASLSEDTRAKIRDDGLIYAGLLYHVATAIALTVFVMVMLYGIPPRVVSLPLLGAIGLLVVFFGLAATTYGSLLGSYLSLSAIGLSILHLTSMANLNRPSTSLDWESEAFSLLGLAFMVTASLFSRKVDSEREMGLRVMPTEWSGWPLILREKDWLLLWQRPLRDASICYAILGLLVILIDIAQVPGADWVPFRTLIACLASAATFLLAARRFNSAVPTYIAAIMLTVGMLPLLMIVGGTIVHGGVALAVLGTLLWVAGFTVERFSFRKPDSLEPASPFVNVYEKPFIRCSAVLATLAVGYSMLAWIFYESDISQRVLVVACVLAGATLLLCARSYWALQQFLRARLLVYLACAALAGGSLAVAIVSWGFGSMGPVTGLVALVLASAGAFLVEMSRIRTAASPEASASFRLFGEPITHCALFLAVAASVLASSELVGQLIAQWKILGPEAQWIRFNFAPQAITWIMSAATCLLGIRAIRHAVWLHAAVVLGSSGALLLATSQLQWSTGQALIVVLLAANLLVTLAQLIRRHSARVEALSGVPAVACERACFGWPLLVTTSLLIGQCVYLGVLLPGAVLADPNWPWILSSLLSGLCFLQVWFLLQRVELVHLLIATSLVGTGGAGLVLDWPFFTTDVQLSTLALEWGAVAQLMRLTTRISVKSIGPWITAKQLDQAVRGTAYWWFGMTVASLLITLPVSLYRDSGFSNTVITLAMATVGCTAGGYLWRHSKLVTVAAILLPLSVESATLVYGGPALLLEFAGLIGVMIGITYLGLASCLVRGEKSISSDGLLRALRPMLESLSEVLVGLGAILTLVAMSQLEPALPLAVSLSLIGAYWLWLAWNSTREVLVYFSVCALTSSLLYFVAGIFGVPIAPGTIAAFAVIGASFLLFGVNILASRSTESKLGVFVRPTYYLAILGPVALLVATPFELTEVAALTVLSASAFYMFIAHQAQTRWATYVAIILFNVAVYIWLPVVREYTGLYQLYVVPAAVTVLVFAHLHRNELNHAALSSIRFAASGAILAASTIEVFAMDEPSLVKFIAVLSLSLIGTAAGIALRVRPFVYIGLAFLMLNVIGQLGIQFQREGGIVRAVILITVGVLILGVMIFFNVHRERILRQYRSFLADKQWE